MRNKTKVSMALFTVFAMTLLLSLSVGSGTGIQQMDITKIEIVASMSSNPDPGTPFQPGNGSNFRVNSSNMYQIRTQSGFRLNLTVDKCVEMNMTQYEHYEDAPQTTNKTMNRYMKIEMNQTAGVNATMAWDIDDDDLAGLNRSTLRFAFHNRTGNTWQHVEQNWHEGNMVYCNTTHFSTWTITGELANGNPTPGTPFQAGNGTNFQVKPGNQYQVRTQSRFMLNLTVDKCVEMNITECNQYEEAPQTTTRTMNRYMKIEMNESAGVNATMAWDIDDEDLAGMNRSTLRFAFHNGTTNTWQHVEQNWHEGNMVYCNTTHFSTWTITGELANGNPTPGTPFQAGNGTQFQLQGGNQYRIRTQSGFQMNMSVDAQANMTITESETNPFGQMNQNQKHLGNFWNFSLSGTDGVNATLSWSFQQGDVQGMKEESLKFAFYNETANTWQYGEQNWKVGNTVYCNTTHFSTWTVVGDEDVTSSPGFEITLSIVALSVGIIPARRRRK